MSKASAGQGRPESRHSGPKQSQIRVTHLALSPVTRWEAKAKESLLASSLVYTAVDKRDAVPDEEEGEARNLKLSSEPTQTACHMLPHPHPNTHTSTQKERGPKRKVGVGIEDLRRSLVRVLL